MDNSKVYSAGDGHYWWDCIETSEREFTRCGGQWVDDSSDVTLPDIVGRWIDAHHVAFDSAECVLAFECRIFGESGYGVDADPLPGEADYCEQCIEVRKVALYVSDQPVDQAPIAIVQAAAKCCDKDLYEFHYNE